MKNQLLLIALLLGSITSAPAYSESNDAQASCHELYSSQVEWIYFNRAYTGHIFVVDRTGTEVASAFNGYDRHPINLNGAGARDPFRTLKIILEKEPVDHKPVSLRVFERVSKSTQQGYLKIKLNLNEQEREAYYDYLESQEGQAQAQTCSGGAARALAKAGFSLPWGLRESPVFCVMYMGFLKKLGNPKIESLEYVGPKKSLLAEFFDVKRSPILEGVLVPAIYLAMKVVKFFGLDEHGASASNDAPTLEVEEISK